MCKYTIWLLNPKSKCAYAYAALFWKYNSACNGDCATHPIVKLLSKKYAMSQKNLTENANRASVAYRFKSEHQGLTNSHCSVANRWSQGKTDTCDGNREDEENHINGKNKNKNKNKKQNNADGKRCGNTTTGLEWYNNFSSTFSHSVSSVCANPTRSPSVICWAHNVETTPGRGHANASTFACADYTTTFGCLLRYGTDRSTPQPHARAQHAPRDKWGAELRLAAVQDLSGEKTMRRGVAGDESFRLG